MPKEITYTSDGAYLAMPDGNEYPEGSPESERAITKEAGGKWFQRGIHVGWVKGRFVEIGAASFDPSRELPTNGVFMSLDRDGINRLIRSLRKARDQAYGADAWRTRAGAHTPCRPGSTTPPKETADA